jgi:alpha-1,2-glucosyltransferase
VLPYAVPIVAFLAFWRWNGEISLSLAQASIHPDLSLHVGNLYFALMLCGALLPLHVLAGLPDFSVRIRRQPWACLVPLLAFAVFWWGFHADNPFNAAIPSYYVRNQFLLAVDGDLRWRLLAG